MVSLHHMGSYLALSRTSAAVARQTSKRRKHSHSNIAKNVSSQNLSAAAHSISSYVSWQAALNLFSQRGTIVFMRMQSLVSISCQSLST